MKIFGLQRRTLALFAVILALLLLFIYVALRAGPLAPIAVTTTQVELRSLAPSLFGIGTVEAGYTYKIGPTHTSRLKQINVQVGDLVTAGQVLGEMDNVDLADKLVAQQAATRRAEALVEQAEATQKFAQAQVERYESLLASKNTSAESVALKRQELALAKATLKAATADIDRLAAEFSALLNQKENLQLKAPAAGLVVARNSELGSTVVAGQAVVELIDPASLWVHVRFDQVNARGLAANLPASITLRSQQGVSLLGKVLRVEPLADAVTEEVLAKVIFNEALQPLPPLGELAEVTVQLLSLPVTAVIPNAAIRVNKGQRGVWKLTQDQLVFIPLLLGRSDLDGYVQVKEGLNLGDEIVLYSEKALTAKSRLQITKSLVGKEQ